MKVILHKMLRCSLCGKAMRLLRHWNIKYTYILDVPEEDRPYPYITIEYEYEELVDLIARGVIR